jgi:hypothetical protein|tara:strand:+ start:782 stop:1012 length:231 start_codon:yes stop_codon:yes gene_type:complete
LILVLHTDTEKGDFRNEANLPRGGMKFGDRTALVILTFCASSTLATLLITYEFKANRKAQQQLQLQQQHELKQKTK